MADGTSISPEGMGITNLNPSEPKPTSPSKQKIRSFTKSTSEGREARHNTAVEIMSVRKRHTGFQQDIDDLYKSLSNTNIAVEQQRQFAEHENRQIDYLRGQVGLAEASLISQMYGLFRRESPRVKYLKSWLTRSEADLASDQREINAHTHAEQVLKEDIEKYEQEKSQLKQAQDILDNFYRDQGEKTREFQEQFQKEQARRKDIKERSSLEKIIQENQIIFLHGISPEIHPIVKANNNWLRADADNWQTRLAIILSLRPDICAYTLKEGDNSLHMFSKMGVIINKGTTIFSNPSDAGTRVVGLNRRERIYDGKTTPSHMEMEPEEVTESINTAINKREANTYNEFVVSQPEIAGFYVCSEPEIIDRPYATPFEPAPTAEIVKSIVALGIPLYIINNGRVYETQYRVNPNGKVEVHQDSTPISPVNLLNRNVSLNPWTYEDIKKRAEGAIKAA